VLYDQVDYAGLAGSLGFDAKGVYREVENLMLFVHNYTIIVYLGIRAGEVPSGGFFGDFEVAVFLMDGADHSMVLTSSRSPRR